MTVTWWLTSSCCPVAAQRAALAPAAAARQMAVCATPARTGKGRHRSRPDVWTRMANH